MSSPKPTVLILCTGNSCRSHLAEGILRQAAGDLLEVASAGSKPAGYVHPLAIKALQEIGIDISKHKPMTFEELEDWEGLNFDLIVSLAPEAHHKALDLTRTIAADVEYWPTQDPTAVEGSREQRLDAYREVRDQLLDRIRKRFGRESSGNE